MSKKKVFLMIVAMMLVCVISVAGTLAYLSQTTTAVTNTFSGQVGLVNNFKLLESEVTMSTAEATYGNYVAVSPTNKVTTNNYSGLVPGATLLKDPAITFEKPSVPAYLYLGVDENGFAGVINTYALENHWLATDITYGEYTIYVYAKDGKTASLVTAAETTGLGIIVDDQLTVSNGYVAKDNEQISLNFTAYMGQASAATDANAVFNAIWTNS